MQDSTAVPAPGAVTVLDQRRTASYVEFISGCAKRGPEDAAPHPGHSIVRYPPRAGASSCPCHLDVMLEGFISPFIIVDCASEPILSILEQAPHIANTRETGRDADRRAAMAVLAQAQVEEIETGLRAVGAPLDYVELRAPETGLVMVRGRIGGDGAAFNLGEATVTRAAVQIASGEVGFSYILGRDDRKARLCAVCDALWQSKRHRDAVERCVLAPIRTRIEAACAAERAETASTRVDFFTLVRGED